MGTVSATTDSAGGTSTGTTGISWRDPRLVVAMLLLVPVVIATVWVARPLGTPADLLAIWVAGEFWQMGRVDEIYPPARELFTMLPPDSWVDWLASSHGYRESVYPFLYPPLWAVVMGAIAPTDFAPVAEAALWINAGLLAGTAVLAVRASGALLHPVAHVALVVVTFLLTQIAAIGYLQGQPHILVAFLVVLAIERSRAGAGTAAGVALALAASIKLFPAAYVVIWLARGEKRALASFAVAGAALAAASILLAGWPLHRAFLDNIGRISRSLLITGNSATFDVIVGQLVPPEKVWLIQGPNRDALGQVREAWLVAPRPALWGLVANAGLLAVLAGSAVAARRVSDRALYAGVWPLLVTLSVTFMPTGWIYYLIPAAVFAPAMLAGLPRARGASLFLVGLLMFFAARLQLVRDWTVFPIAEAFFYVGGTLVWSLGFALMARNLAEE